MRYGNPGFSAALCFDEYQHAAALHIQGAEWRLFEFFLGEFEEIDNVFAEVDKQVWKELVEAAEFIRSGRLAEKAEPDLSGSNKDPWAQNRTTGGASCTSALSCLSKRRLQRVGSIVS
ncbi:baeRF10 domain-containing protein [Micrococcus luteus]|uniref:baeRF10 domain-containing protein n=1 Tax=Micrococcus luteus TaxID=1270 RepID=UPI0011C01C3C|nr:hypothetical protein [Micrococcus luteus]